MEPSLSRKPSRTFPSFRVFKGPKPPPPPPKDRYYIPQSPSTVSLSARSFTANSSYNDIDAPDPLPALAVPPSPQQQYASYATPLLSPSPSPSRSNLAAPSSASSETSSFKRGLLKFGSSVRRIGGSKSPRLQSQDPNRPPEPEDDGSISYPWNFEHHVHVDDSLSGLPPSWSSSLHEAGFNSDEIEALRSRRPYATSLLNGERPATPQEYVLANPAPRFDSLRRRPSNGTTSDSSVSHTNSDAPLPRPQLPYGNPLLNASAPSVATTNGNGYFTDPPRAAPTPPIPRNPTQTSLTSSPTPTATTNTPTTTSTPTAVSHESDTSIYTTASSNAFPTAAEEKRAMAAANLSPLTTFRVTNDADPLSPPPAYGSPSGSAQGLSFDNVGLPPPLSSNHRHSGSPSNLRQVFTIPVNGDDDDVDEFSTVGAVSSASASAATLRKQAGAGEDDEDRRRTILAKSRLSALPPRLSFHQDDGEDWSEGLLCAVLTPPASPSNFTPLSATFPVSAKSTATLEESQISSSSTEAAGQRRKQPKAPLPSITLPPVDKEDDLQPSNTPLWNELMGMVQSSDSPLNNSFPMTPATPGSAGLASPSSPSFKNSPRNSGGDRDMLSESALAEHNNNRDSEQAWASRLLVPNGALGARDRDSNQSILSDASTVTDATVAMAQRVSVVVHMPTNVQYSASGSSGSASTAAFSSNRPPAPPGPPPRTPPPQPPSPGGPWTMTPSGQSLSPMSATFPHHRDTSPSSRPLSNGSTSARSSASSGVSMTMSDSSSPSLRQTLYSSSNEEDIKSPRSSAHQGTVAANNVVEVQVKSRLSRSSISPSPVDTAPPSKWPGDTAVAVPRELQREDTDRGYSIVADVMDDWMQEETRSPVTPAALTPRSFMAYSDDEEEPHFPAPLPPKKSTSQERGTPELQRPTISISNGPSSMLTSPLSAATSTPATPALRYRGWQHTAITPIEQFVDDSVNPQDKYYDLVEIAEGESGSVFSARVHGVVDGAEGSVVAIKNIPILPSENPKIGELKKELTLMSKIRHENILAMDALLLDLVDDALWIRMELMDRSLADLIGLLESGVVLDERMMARFTSDILHGLAHLRQYDIAHRDVRSDNLLLNAGGVLKLADFSNAVKFNSADPFQSEAVGVIYWQAPEMRRGQYDTSKVDVWSLGATLWEMASGEPPFVEIEDPRQIGDTLPTLAQSELYSRSFHDFLRLCSQSASSRPDPIDLISSTFIKTACSRSDIIQLISQCRSIEEEALAGGDS